MTYGCMPSPSSLLVLYLRYAMFLSRQSTTSFRFYVAFGVATRLVAPWASSHALTCYGSPHLDGAIWLSYVATIRT